MEGNKEEFPVPLEQPSIAGKMKKYTEDIDFSKGVLNYVDVDFSEYRKKLI